MTLSDIDIKRRMADGDLVITPLPHIGPCSVDLRLGDSFAIIKKSWEILTLDEPVEYERFKADAYILLPGEFVLATTVEYLKIPSDLRGRLDGRSSVGRKGLFVHNAGFFDSGFEGEATLELFNFSGRPFEIKAGQRICQIEFTQCLTPSEKPYAGKYQGQRGATGSRSHQDKEMVS